MTLELATLIIIYVWVLLVLFSLTFLLGYRWAFRDGGSVCKILEEANKSQNNMLEKLANEVIRRKAAEQEVAKVKSSTKPRWDNLS